ncbi:MAG TPA: hypothetical protein VMN37_07735 [Gemmatimonadales bacterium]|nr:hypothetical protein [Gemmatimonadales bacterium]
MELQRWAGRACVAMVAGLSVLGYHFGNIRFVPVAVGFAILAGLCYSGHLPTPSRSLTDSGRHRAL